MIEGKQIKNASITAAKLNLTTPVNPTDPATKQFTAKMYSDCGDPTLIKIEKLKK